MKYFFTDYEEFVGNIDPNYHEVYELYCIAGEKCASSCLFHKNKQFDTPNVIVTHDATHLQLLLTPKSAAALRKWLQKEYMHGEDAEDYYTMEQIKEKND